MAARPPVRGGSASSSTTSTASSSNNSSPALAAKNRPRRQPPPKKNTEKRNQEDVVYEAFLPDYFSQKRVCFVRKKKEDVEEVEANDDDGDSDMRSSPAGLGQVSASEAESDEDDNAMHEEADSDSASDDDKTAYVFSAKSNSHHSEKKAPAALQIPAPGSSPSPYASPSPSSTHDTDGDEAMTVSAAGSPEKHHHHHFDKHKPQPEMLPIPRRPVEIPTLPPPKPRIEMEDLPPFKRPSLRVHRTEEQRLVRVEHRVNYENRIERLIDANSTLVTYQPHNLSATTSSFSSSMFSPSLAASSSLATRSPLLLGGGNGGSGSGGVGLSLFPRQSSGSPQILSRRSSLPPLHTSMPPPGSPGGPKQLPPSVFPVTPSNMNLSRQSSTQQLTYPMSTPAIGPKSSIVTQPIPYGRIMIKPQRREVLYASSVPLSAYSSVHREWYLPTSHPCTLYITLDLPGHIDYEIKIDNVFILPDAVDQVRLKVQQKLMYEGKLQAKNEYPKDELGRIVKKRTSEAISGTSAAADTSMHVRNGSTGSMDLSATQPLPSNINTTNGILSQPRRRYTSRSHHRGGHLQRKSSNSRTRSETELMSELDEMEEVTMKESAARGKFASRAQSDRIDREFARANPEVTRFGPPTMKDVRVSIRSKGQSLIPTSAHTVSEPVYATNTTGVNPSRTATIDAQKKFDAVLWPEGYTGKFVKGTGLSPAGAFAGDGMPTPVRPLPYAVKSTPYDWNKNPFRITPSIESTKRVVVPQGPFTLSEAHPHIDFATGSLTLERMKPRLGGWVIKRDLSMNEARKYIQTDPEKALEFMQRTVKEEVQIKSEDQFDDYTLRNPDGSTKQIRFPKLTKPSSPANDRSSKVPWEIEWAKQYTPDFVSDQHDIAEVGDVIRLVLHTHEQTQAKSKKILPLHYELTIEGVRVAPVNDAPPYPAPRDMYRFGTAPKEVVEAEALSTRLTTSQIPSTLITGAGLHHWSEVGRPAQVKEPVLFPSTFYEDSAGEEDAMDGDEDEDEKPLASKQPATASSGAAVSKNGHVSSDEEEDPILNPSKSTHLPIRLRSRASRATPAISTDPTYYEKFPQENWSDYYQPTWEVQEDEEDGVINPGQLKGAREEYEQMKLHEEENMEVQEQAEEEQDLEYDWSDTDWETSDEEGLTLLPRTARVVRKEIRSDDEDHDDEDERPIKSTARMTAREIALQDKKRRQQQQQAPGSGSGKSRAGRNGTAAKAAAAAASRARKEVSDEEMSEVEDDDSPPEAFWVACDKCAKWRKMPDNINKDELPAIWYCSMNTDKAHNNCKDIEEKDETTGQIHDGAGIAAPASATPKKAEVKPPTPVKPKAADRLAQQQHLALLFPCPRIPTTEDVCFKCETELNSMLDEPPGTLDYASTVFCHGPCNRMWHLNCVGRPIDLPTVPQPFTTVAMPKAGLPVGTTFHPSTHIMPFTPFEKEYMYCSDCLALEATCWVCFKKDTIDPDRQFLSTRDPKTHKKIDNPQYLMQCPYSMGCGKFYHQKCLMDLKGAVNHKSSRLAGHGALEPNLVPRPRAGLICALHTCSTCNVSGTTSINQRDIGRTLVHCTKCTEAVHHSQKCRKDEDIKLITKKYGVCWRHDSQGEDYEGDEIRDKRNASKKIIRMETSMPPRRLFGYEPEESSEEEEEEEEEDSSSK